MEDYTQFTTQWLARAERQPGKDTVDIGDKFICLWISFNGWLRMEFGENVSDYDLIEGAKKNQPLIDAYNTVCTDKDYQRQMTRLGQYRVLDMRDENDTKRAREFIGTFDTLLDVIYKVRCNLFHGRKNHEENEKDKELVEVSYYLLLPILKKIIE